MCPSFLSPYPFISCRQLPPAKPDPRLGARESTEAIHAGEPLGTGQGAKEQIWASNRRIKSTVEI